METQDMLSWNVKAEKKVYGPGDKVSIMAAFKPSDTFTGKVDVHTLLTKVGDEEFPVGIIPSTVDLRRGEEKDVVLREFEVTDDLPPGEYVLKIGVEFGKKPIDAREVHFRIEGTPKPGTMQLNISRDKESKERAVVFFPEDRQVYVQVTSDVEMPVLSGMCIGPVRETTALQFENMTARVDIGALGPYQLRVKLTAKGYRLLERRVSFSVIERRPEIRKHSVLRKK